MKPAFLFLFYFVMSRNCIRVGGQQFDSFHDGREIPACGSHLLSVAEGTVGELVKKVFGEEGQLQA